MKSVLSILVLTFFVPGCTEPQIHTITCQIEGLQNDTALVAFIPLSNEEEQIIDTVEFKEGLLTYDIPINELHEAFIIPFDLIHQFENGRSYPLPASRIRFFIDALEQIEIKGRIEEQCVNYNVSGNTLSEELTVARKMKLDLFKERIPIEYNINSLDTAKISEKEYWHLRRENDEKYNAQNIAYIQENPNSHYSARLLLEIRNKELASTLYSNLSEQVKDEYFGKIITDMVNGWMLTTPGLEFPNIIDQTLDGQEFELAKFRGNYVLVDFWGSWCKPCLAEVPQLRKLVEQYNGKLKVIGIACNDNKERLTKTLESYGINWTQIQEGQEKEKNYSERFGVRSFPTKLLLDSQGKIVKIYSGMDESLYSDIKDLIDN